MSPQYQDKTKTYEKQLSKFFDEANGNRIQWCWCGYPCELTGKRESHVRYVCRLCESRAIIEKLGSKLKELRQEVEDVD